MNDSNEKQKINEGNLLGGIFLIGFAVFEFSTSYFTKNYLVPYQNTELLRNIFSSGIFPIIIGLWGVRNIYDELRNFATSRDNHTKPDFRYTIKGASELRDTSECFGQFMEYRDKSNQCLTCELKESCKIQ